jgi:fatty acid desaturase
MTTTTSDPLALPALAPSASDRVADAILRDPRDRIVLRRVARMAAILVSCAVVMFALPTWATALLAIPYLAAIFLAFGGPYTLMLHVVAHRPVFKQEWSFLGALTVAPLGMLLGHTPTSFFVHHVGMHHAENNMTSDLSGTIAYRRDSLAHFLHYWARFFFTGHLHLTRYLWLRGRTKLLRRFWLGEAVWATCVGSALWLDPAGAFVVLVAPFLVLRVVMMTGNFAQHAFVDVDDPDNAFRNSTCLTNTRYNHRCYNDGYHIVHHIKPSLHWTEMASWYQSNLPKFAENDAVVFDGIRDNQQIFWLLMRGDYGRLADHLVNFRDRTRDERIEWLKSRVQRQRGPIPRLLGFESAADAARGRYAA